MLQLSSGYSKEILNNINFLSHGLRIHITGGQHWAENLLLFHTEDNYNLSICTWRTSPSYILLPPNTHWVFSLLNRLLAYTNYWHLTVPIISSFTYTKIRKNTRKATHVLPAPFLRPFHALPAPFPHLSHALPAPFLHPSCTLPMPFPRTALLLPLPSYW